MNGNLDIKLDEEIKSLFYWMIRSWDKITNVDRGYIYFDNGISLSAFEEGLDESETSTNDLVLLPPPALSLYNTTIQRTGKLMFYINTPYKKYKVPEITDKFEYFEILDILEDSLRRFEKKMLSQYLQHFSEDVFTDGIKINS